MLRPAIYILIYTILGILSGIYITNALFIYVCVFLTFVITVSICICRKNLLYFMFFVPFLTAFAVGSVSGLYTDKNIDMLADTEYPVKINAIVNEKANTYDDTFKYNITASQLSYGESTIKQNINMFMYTDKELQIGDTVKFTSLLKHGNVKRNNADFNEIIYFKTKKIQYKTFPDSIVVTGHKNTLYGNIKKVSYMFQNTINKLYPQKEAGLITAMLLGDRNDLDDETYKLYQNAGIVHIISVSGLHISILAGLVLFLLRPLGRYPSSLLTALFLIFYTILAGASPSVVRASLMMFLYILSGLISRKYDLLSSTSIICCVLLMYNPYYIFDLGFLYSFTSVFAIGFSSEIIKKYKIENKLLNI
ncbi:MAG: ComEC/Rec2 family competence protein, partial [Clostridia bacterium]|nr:ComEC/Rec2 family competence protein [Clostridia bacterium]